MIFYGWGTKLKNAQFIGKFYCNHCGRFSNYYIAKEIFRITIFFIPVIWWTKRYFILCDNCHMGKEIEKEYAKALMNEKRNMYHPMKLDMLMQEALEMIKADASISSEALFDILKNKYQLNFEESYIKGFMEEICQVYNSEITTQTADAN